MTNRTTAPFTTKLQATQQSNKPRPTYYVYIPLEQVDEHKLEKGDELTITIRDKHVEVRP